VGHPQSISISLVGLEQKTLVESFQSLLKESHKGAASFKVKLQLGWALPFVFLFERQILTAALNYIF
jgi:hypothetical protein